MTMWMLYIFFEICVCTFFANNDLSFPVKSPNSFRIDKFEVCAPVDTNNYLYLIGCMYRLYIVN